MIPIPVPDTAKRALTRDEVLSAIEGRRWPEDGNAWTAAVNQGNAAAREAVIAAFDAPAPESDRHPATTQLLRWFAYDHLPAGLARQTSASVFDLAHLTAESLPDGPELTAGLRKLLEAKDCLVRAAIEASR